MLLAAGGLLLAACGGDDDEPETTTRSADETCAEAAPAEPQQVNLNAPKKKVAPGEKITATVETNCGDFSFELDTKESPKTANSFVYLVDEGVYDGTAIHRVVPGYVIQGGDPTDTGTGGPGYTIVEEPPANAEYTRGTVAMAKNALEPAGTSGSQFFVVAAAADAGLPPDYAILGQLTGDEKAVDRIEAQADPELGPEGGEPAVPVVIKRITLER